MFYSAYISAQSIARILSVCAAALLVSCSGDRSASNQAARLGEQASAAQMEWNKINWWCTESIKALMTASRNRQFDDPQLGAKIRDLRGRSADLAAWEAAAVEALRGSSEQILEARAQLDEEMRAGSLTAAEGKAIGDSLSSHAALFMAVAVVGDGTTAIRKRIAETVDIAARASTGLLPVEMASAAVSKLEQELRSMPVPKEWSALAN